MCRGRVSDGVRDRNSIGLPGRLRQQSMEEGMDTTVKRYLDKKWAAFFFEANIAFNVSRLPSSISAVRATSESKISYNPPKYCADKTVGGSKGRHYEAS